MFLSGFNFVRANVTAGNELSGSGVGASVSAEQYAKDLLNLKKIIDEIYATSTTKPSLLAPGGFYEENWFAKLLQATGSGVVNIVTHHIYNLGPGNIHLVPKPFTMYKYAYVVIFA